MKIQLILTVILLAPFLINAQSENALFFDNIDDHVVAPGASATIANANAVSMSMWVYPENAFPTFPDYDGYGGIRNNFDADFYLLQLTATDIEARFRNNLGTAFDIVFPGLVLNTWQHFALTYNGAMLTLYHNGTAVDSVSASGTITNTVEAFYIGMLPWTSANFYMNGKIDEVSLWSKALTPAEVSCLYSGAVNPVQTGLELYYRFNQGTASGNNLSVSSLLDATGSINGLLNNFALNGTTSNFVTGVTSSNTTTINDVLCPGDSYVFGSQTITVPGTYYEAYSLPGGCDSIVQLNLASVAFNTTVSQTGPLLTSMQSGAAYQWIDCGNGNTPVAGATGQSFTATSNGQYAVFLTFGNCSDTTLCVNVTNVGLHDLHDALLIASPNPFSENFTLVLPANHQNREIRVYDSSGRKVYTAITDVEKIIIPAVSWDASVYYITVEGYTKPLRLIKY